MTAFGVPPEVEIVPSTNKKPHDRGAKKPAEGYEKLYGILLDAIPCSVLLVDRSLRVASVNQYFLKKSLRTMADTLGRSLRDVFPGGILEHVDIPRQVLDAFHAGVALRGQRIVYRAPGIPVSFYYYSVLPVIRADPAEAEYVMLVMEDVTEQARLSEQVMSVERQLASVIEHATDAILSTDTQGRIKTWNTAAEKLSGYSLQQVQERALFDYLAEKVRGEFQGVLRTMLQSGEPQMVSTDLLTSRGDRLPISWVCSPMRDNQGTLLGMVAVGRDMTGAKQFEARLLQSQKLAALGIMAGGIAHELRNPLTLCSSGAYFLLQDDITPEFRGECAEQIRSGVERASLVIENLLRFARPQSDAELGKVDIMSVVQNSLCLADNLAKLQRIRVVTEMSSGPLWILGNETLLQQVFINLLINAVDSMPDGGSLRVSVQAKEPNVTVSIADTGCGIASDDLSLIFDPFYTRSPYKKGTGLGLSICYSIIKQLQGSIRAASTAGKGSEFVVELPLQLQDQAGGNR
jgi:PAS domain S-box-containing protein